MIVIELSRMEIAIAGTVGMFRFLQDENSEHKYGRSEDPEAWKLNLDGAIAELAVARWAEKYWLGLSGLGSHDVFPKVEVRSTYKTKGSLILREDDQPAKYVLVLLHALPRVTMAGWITLEEGKQDEYIKSPGKNRPPAWFVPQDKLNDMNLLKKNRGST